MAFCTMEFWSPALHKRCGMNLLIPQEGDGPFPVLYLLHGLSDNHTAWCRQTSIERYLWGREIIVAMPDGGRSWYVNDTRPGGGEYENFIVQDVVGFVDRVLPSLPRREGRIIGGLSMGGYGSTMLALKHHELFAGVTAHSSAFDFAHVDIDGRDDVNPFAQVVGLEGGYDVFALAEAFAARSDRPELPMQFTCGTEDFLHGANVRFHEHLEKLQLPHEYAEYPGAHEWSYWDARLPEIIRFALKVTEG